MYSASIDPVKQETVQLIKGNITLERDPIIGAVKLTIARFYNSVSTVYIKKLETGYFKILELGV